MLAIFVLLATVTLGFGNFPEPLVAFHEGRHAMRRNEVGTWILDADQPYLEDAVKILAYCRKVFTNYGISKVKRLNETFEIKNWCLDDSKRCDDSFKVKPYLCVDSAQEVEMASRLMGFEGIPNFDEKVNYTGYYKQYVSGKDIPGAETEHERFLYAMNSLKAINADRFAEVMGNWISAKQTLNKMQKMSGIPLHGKHKQLETRYLKDLDDVYQENEELIIELKEIHQERLTQHFRELKKDAMYEFLQALYEKKSSQILKSFYAFVNIEQRDKQHSLHRYEHILRNHDTVEMERMRKKIIYHIRQIDIHIDEALKMLRLLPESVFEKVDERARKFLKTFEYLNADVKRIISKKSALSPVKVIEKKTEFDENIDDVLETLIKEHPSIQREPLVAIDYANKPGKIFKQSLDKLLLDMDDWNPSGDPAEIFEKSLADEVKKIEKSGKEESMDFEKLFKGNDDLTKENDRITKDVYGIEKDINDVILDDFVKEIKRTQDEKFMDPLMNDNDIYSWKRKLRQNKEAPWKKIIFGDRTLNPKNVKKYNYWGVNDLSFKPKYYSPIDFLIGLDKDKIDFESLNNGISDSGKNSVEFDGKSLYDIVDKDNANSMIPVKDIIEEFEKELDEKLNTILGSKEASRLREVKSKDDGLWRSGVNLDYVRGSQHFARDKLHPINEIDFSSKLNNIPESEEFKPLALNHVASIEQSLTGISSTSSSVGLIVAGVVISVCVTVLVVSLLLFRRQLRGYRKTEVREPIVDHQSKDSETGILITSLRNKCLETSTEVSENGEQV